MTTTRSKALDPQQRTIKLYCSPALWDALSAFAEAQGLSRGRVTRLLLEDQAAAIFEIARAIQHGRQGRLDLAKDKLANVIGSAVLDMSTALEQPRPPAP